MAKAEKYTIGVDLGGTSVKIGIVSEKGKISKKLSVESRSADGPDAVIEQIKKGIYEILKKSKKKIYGIGIGAPGVVSVKKGTVENPPNFPGWEKVNLGKLIEKEFNKKVYVENDANAAAIGELIFGMGKKYDSFIMVTLGTGVGGGIIINNKIYRGEFGAAGEIGHVTINNEGPRCNCGSFGCIEAYVGNHYLVSRIKKELPDHPDSKIWELIDDDLEQLSPKIIDTASESGDPYAQSIVKKMGYFLGCALASVSNLLDVSTFIIGGGVSGFGKPLFDSIKETASLRVLTPLRDRIKVHPAKLKNDAGIKGASALVFYKS
ncbi:MAG TPA: ROK family protein [Ignavibacteriaceae bacterium]|nr:ROK family protein [Ignavibacteriaceae bacterium]